MSDIDAPKALTIFFSLAGAAAVQCVWVPLCLGPAFSDNQHSLPGVAWWLFVYGGSASATAIGVGALLRNLPRLQLFVIGSLATSIAWAVGCFSVVFWIPEPPNAPHDWGQGIGILLGVAAGMALSPLGGVVAVLVAGIRRTLEY